MTNKEFKNYPHNLEQIFITHSEIHSPTIDGAIIDMCDEEICNMAYDSQSIASSANEMECSLNKVKEALASCYAYNTNVINVAYDMHDAIMELKNAQQRLKEILDNFCNAVDNVVGN